MIQITRLLHSPRFIKVSLLALVGVLAISWWTVGALVKHEGQKNEATKDPPTTVASNPSKQAVNTSPSTTPKPATTSPTPASPSLAPSASSTPVPAQPKTTAPSPKPSPSPALTPTPNPGSSSCTNPAWSSSADFASWQNNGYIVNNNKWNTAEAGPQTIYACAWNKWHITSNQPGSGTDDSVKTYPDTQKLVDIPLSTMTNIMSSFNVTVPSGGGTVTPNSKQWNAAYDIWLNDYDYEVMIWTNWTMNWQYWYGVYGGEVVTIDGVTYKVYTNQNKGIWFVRQNVTNQGSVNVASVLRWAVNKGWLPSSASINAIEYGFEIAYTGMNTNFYLNDFSLTTN